jgi:hypothetical protein
MDLVSVVLSCISAFYGTGSVIMEFPNGRDEYGTAFPVLAADLSLSTRTLAANREDGVCKTKGIDTWWYILILFCVFVFFRVF